MRFLLDENISYRLVRQLNDYVPDTLHVSRTGLARPAKDIQIWEFAKRNNYTLVTLDEDFQDLANMYGFPPKIVLLRTRNSSTKYIAKVLLEILPDILLFDQSTSHGLLEIF